jgi:hypothetical protein
MDGLARPWAPQVRPQSSTVQIFRDFALGTIVLDKSAIDRLDDGNLLRWTGHQNDAICVDAFILACR